MGMVRILRSFFCLPFFLFACSSSPDGSSDAEVLHHGTLRGIMQEGDLSANVSLEELEEERLYALGAVEGLQGEVLVLDGEAYIASVRDGELHIEGSYDHKAALLVRTRVKEWKSFEIPVGMGMQKLPAFIEKKALEAGIDTGKAYPFMIEGMARSFEWHVIDWENGDTVHTHHKHKHSGLRGSEKGRDVAVLGFYSKGAGVFTHHKSPLHMHVRTVDGDLIAHLEQIRIGKGMRLKLPLEQDEER